MSVGSDAGDVIDGVPLGVYIDSSWREARSGETLVKTDPATEQVLAEFASAGPADVDAAVLSARAAFDGGEWSRLRGPDRARILLKVADLIERDAIRLATIHSFENGVSVRSALDFDVRNAADAFRYQAGWADKINGSVSPPLDVRGRPTHSFVVREALGVVAAILPWNGPVVDAADKLAPALAAGCAVVLKPAEQSLLSVMYLVKLLQEAGLPAGAVNVVPGRGDVAGEALIRNPGVDKISFTGSVEVGRHIMRAAAENFTRVTLELGGKSPTVIFDDADLNTAIGDAARGVFANQGQICAAGSRILVHKAVYDEVVEGLADAVSSVRLGNPREVDVSMGPLITREQQDRVLNYIAIGSDEGARLIGARPVVPDRGYFVAPAIFADASNDMRVAQEEIFGPVATVIPFTDESEAVEIANGSQYGLAATVFTADISRAHRMTRALRVGTVWVNGWGAVDKRLPWGGVKNSGIGREGGLEGVLGYTEPKTVRIIT
jgi:betaine-aldehyde dehydrogenase